MTGPACDTIPVRLARAFASTTALALLALPTACSAGERQVAEVELIAPIAELSGLALRTTPAGDELLAVGDEARAILVMPLTRGGVPDPTKAREVALPMPEAAGGSELEGVAVAPDGAVWALVERGEVFAFMLAGDTATLSWRKPIVVPPEHTLYASWQADANARAEGLTFVGARVFIVKQQSPAALIELTVEPERLVAGRTTTLDDMSDASDLQSRGEALFVIGAASERICELALPGDKGPASVPCARTWRMPEALGKGKARWEGLALLGDARVVVGVDRKKSDRPNLAVLRLIAP